MRRLIKALGGKFGWIAAALSSIVYVVCIVRLTSFPMQDYANHVARADVMADLLFHHGSRFGQFFELHLVPVPYVLPDLILTSAVEVFGPAIGAGLFTGIVLLSLPCALLLYARVGNVAPRAWPFVFLLGLYLSTDWFFLMGFMAFRLSLALIVVSLAIAEMLRRVWSVPAYVTYIVVLISGFLTHLTALVFMGAALGASALVRLGFRTTTLRREIYLLTPLVLLFAWYFGVMAESHTSVDSVSYNWATPGESRYAFVTKIRYLRYEFVNFDWHLAIPVIVLFAACMLWPVHDLKQRALRKPVVVEHLVLAVAFLGIYFVLPSEVHDTQYVDIRAVPMITLLLLFSCLRLPTEDSTGQVFGNWRALGLAALLAVVNLAYVMVPLASNDAWIRRYRAVVASIPKGVYVLPIHTETRQPHLLWVASHVILDRDAVIPYLFGVNSGDPMTYFRYKRPRYAPNIQWYREQFQGGPEAMNSAVNWNRVACNYDFLLITMPFDAAFIHVPVVKVTSNDAAALLAIDKQACQAGAPSD